MVRLTVQDPSELPGDFGPVVDEARLERFEAELETRIYDFLGARCVRHEGEDGVCFAVWAPNARGVSVVGDFNDWDAGAHPMRRRSKGGVWERFVPGVEEGALYKYELRSSDGERLEKADPVGLAMELRPLTASVIVGPSRHEWGDAEWMSRRAERQAGDAPVSVYEVHLGSWRRRADGSSGREHGWLGYRELADELLPYVKGLGFTHLELLPITEHPFDASWGYQTVGYFAPTSRYGSPDDFRYFVDRAHRLGLGVLLDWVPGHFPRDAHGLARFDGSALYEHEDPRRGEHPDWETAIYDFGRLPVVSFLISSALFWLREFHLDGLRVDAVASMLYLDYSREDGAWLPNVYGGRENLEAVQFLRLLNDAIHDEYPDALICAEESTAWPNVSSPTTEGGLGFDIKWNMGWMNDTLEYFQNDPAGRSALAERVTFSIHYAFAERFLLPLSHDEVVHLKKSLLSKMPGEGEERFANLRLLYGYMWAHPGKKLLFMGGELGQREEWNHESELDWPVLDLPLHRGLQRFVRDLNERYAERPALHASDFVEEGFEWLDVLSAARGVIAFLRWAPGWEEMVIAVANLSDRAWPAYRLGVPADGEYSVILDSAAAPYANPEASPDPAAAGSVTAADRPLHGRPFSIELDLAPLTILYLVRHRGE